MVFYRAVGVSQILFTTDAQLHSRISKFPIMSKLHGVAFSQRVAGAPPAFVGNPGNQPVETAVETHLSHDRHTLVVGCGGDRIGRSHTLDRHTLVIVRVGKI